MQFTEVQGREILHLLSQKAQEKFSNRLQSVYALGSLAHGGFAPQVSDIDIAFILSSPLLPSDADTISLIKKEVEATKKPLSERASLFWGSVSSLQKKEDGGRFPPLDILDCLQYGVLLFGKEVRTDIPAPTIKDLEIATTLYSLKKWNIPEKIDEFFHPEKIISQGVKYVTKTILFPIRFLYTSFTGNIGKNDDSILWYQKRKEFSAQELGNIGFSLRTESINNKQSVENLLQKELILLYKEYITRYKDRMKVYGETSLLNELQHWEKKLSQ